MSSAASSLSFSVALAGNPNCGKTALFNALTGGRQKVGNYPGVTVEKKEGETRMPSGRVVHVLDLPGTYSLDARTPDEEITRDVLLGRLKEEASPALFVAVADATNLERSLGLVLEIRALGKPVVLALNMMDLAESRGLELDLAALSRELGVTVVPTVATQKKGVEPLLAEVEKALSSSPAVNAAAGGDAAPAWRKSSRDEIQARFAEVDRILKVATRQAARPTVWTDRIDSMVLHPVVGPLILAAVLLVLFQAVFTWASVPADWIKAAVAWAAAQAGALLGDGALKSLIADGVIAGVGAVLVFLPQILLLFLFILLLEDSGYMARAAFLMDRLMGRVGLHGRAFIPLLSGYACAIPGIMATRTIDNRRDRLTTILITPLTTCSARLPVYTLLVGAFIPDRKVLGPLALPAVVMLGLYLAGIFIALTVATVLRRTAFSGPKSPLLLELPTYKWPSLKGVALGLLERSKLFVRRAGTVILSLTVVLWFLSSYPKAPEGFTGPAIEQSYAGRIGHAIEPLIRPIGFDWRVGIALVPGFAAREVMVGALGTVYAVEAADEDKAAEALGGLLNKTWSLATALSLLAWYVVAPQCLSTLAVTRRETNSWKWPAVMLVYLTTLAYAFSFLVYHAALAMGVG